METGKIGIRRLDGSLQSSATAATTRSLFGAIKEQDNKGPLKGHSACLFFRATPVFAKSETLTQFQHDTSGAMAEVMSVTEQSDSRRIVASNKVERARDVDFTAHHASLRRRKR